MILDGVTLQFNEYSISKWDLKTCYSDLQVLECQPFYKLKNIDAFSAESEMLSAKFCHIFHAFFLPTVKMQQNPNLGRKR
jgi:hypothetical protein